MPTCDEHIRRGLLLVISDPSVSYLLDRGPRLTVHWPYDWPAAILLQEYLPVVGCAFALLKLIMVLAASVDSTAGHSSSKAVTSLHADATRAKQIAVGFQPTTLRAMLH